MRIRSWMMLTLVACNGEDPTETGDSDADTDADTDADSDSDTDTDPCAAPSFAGVPPVALWYFDESSGTAADAVGDHDLTGHGIVNFGGGQVGNSVVLDGSSAYYDGAVPVANDALSFAGWVRLDRLPTDFGMIANQGNGAESFTGWLLAVTTSGNPVVYTQGGSGPLQIATTAPAALVTEVWTHVAFTFDAGHVELYVDGAPVADNDVSYATLTMGSNGFALGRDHNQSNRYFPGGFDDLGLWDSALNADDVTALHADGVCGLHSR